jgi:hypothetical protein
MAMTKKQQQQMVNTSKSYPGRIAGSYYASDNKNPGRYTMGKTEANFANARPYASGYATKSKPGSYKKGGKVKKTGIAKVHKGERVLTKKQTKKFDKKKYDKTHKKLYGI